MSDDWHLAYEGYEPAKVGLRETLTVLGNGNFCTRGAATDALADGTHYPGTYLAGGYDRLTSTVGGRTVENEDLVNLPNWLVLAIRIEDGDWLRPDTVQYVEHRHALDLSGGVLERRLVFRDGAGRTTRWHERRIVSMADEHLAALSVEIVPEDWSGRLTVRSAIDGSVINAGVPRYRALEGRHLRTLRTDRPAEDTVALAAETRQSRREVVEAARTRFRVGGAPVSPERRAELLPDIAAEEATFALAPGEPLAVEKVVALHTSRDQGISEAGLAATRHVAEASDFEALEADHRLAWKHLWQEFDLVLDTRADAAQLKLRLHLFHLLQTVSRHSIDRDVGVPPRGWHGEAYRGHVMWDELFIFPLLNLRLPVLTRALLRYRYRRLPEARRLAREAGFHGAMYPWQSGSSGREESQVVHLNPQSGRWIPDVSHRQRHIDAAIAYNIWQYYEVTDDRDFLYDYGAEMLVEIARFWASVATFDEARGRYVIRGVMGPDEFHTAYPDADPSDAGGLDNNAYTNVMAAWVLNRAGDALELMPPDLSARLVERLHLGEAERHRWDEIARNLFVPFHDGVISQFEGYERLREFDWNGYRAKYGDIQRLDRILEAEGDTPNRYKASKQADVLMLFYLFSTEELALLFEQLGYPFDPDTVPRTIDYYLKRTSHGSTLSWVVHSWVLARSRRERSWELFESALDADVADIQGGTTPEGIHLGAMAGTVDLVQRCYTGLEARGNILYLNPVLPEGLERLSTHVRYRHQHLDLEVSQSTLTVRSRQFSAAPITVCYRGRFREVSPGSVYAFRLVDPADRHGRGRQDEQPAGHPAGPRVNQQEKPS